LSAPILVSIVVVIVVDEDRDKDPSRDMAIWHQIAVNMNQDEVAVIPSEVEESHAFSVTWRSLGRLGMTDCVGIA